MSEPMRRRSSSRQLLQNLIRVTAQRSQEDAEEVERERRRRAREKQRGERSPSWPEPPQLNELAHNGELDEELKPSAFLVLEEDEGFSDWSHRLENRHESGAREQKPSAPQWKPDPELEEEEEGWEPERSSQSQEISTTPPAKTSSIKKEVRTSYSSSVFLPQDARHTTGQSADRTSYLVAGTLRPRGGARRVDGEVEQEEQKEEEEEEVQQQQQHTMEDEEDLRFLCEEKEEFHLRGETCGEEDEEEEHKTPDQRSVESGHETREEVNRRAAASICSSEAEEPLNCYGPMSPTFKKLLIQFYPDEVNSRVSPDGKCMITERTESLRKSSNSIRKTPPPVAVSKINKKLEEYTHALEVSSKEGRSGGQVLTDLMSPSEPVAFKKNLFEAREAWSQNSISSITPKDPDGLKVGVADLINQWVRGSEDGSRCSSPSKPAESSSGKRCKFVVMGHGKYEKINADNSCSEDINCQSAGLAHKNL